MYFTRVDNRVYNMKCQYRVTIHIYIVFILTFPRFSSDTLDSRLITGDPRFSLETRRFHWRPADFHWRPADFHWRPPDFHWRSPGFHWRSPGLHLRSPDFHWRPPDFHWRPADFYWRPPDFIEKNTNLFIWDIRFTLETWLLFIRVSNKNSRGLRWKRWVVDWMIMGVSDGISLIMTFPRLHFQFSANIHFWFFDILKLW